MAKPLGPKWLLIFDPQGGCQAFLALFPNSDLGGLKASVDCRRSQLGRHLLQPLLAGRGEVSPQLPREVRPIRMTSDARGNRIAGSVG